MREVGPPPLNTLETIDTGPHEEPAKPARKAKKPAKRLGRPQIGKLFTKRRLATLWLPVLFFGTAAVIAANWNSIRDTTTERADALREAVIDRPEFAIRSLDIRGHKYLSVHEIAAIMGLRPGLQSISSLQFNAQTARDALVANAWVADASVALDPAGALRVTVQERVPYALWRSDQGYLLIDAEGVPIVPANGPGDRPDLPLIIGKGANEAAQEARTLLLTVPLQMKGDILALVRRSGRRWDAITKQGLVLKLPASDPRGALKRYADQSIAQRVRPYAVTGVDLRRPDEPPVIRLEPGTAEMRTDMMRSLRKIDR